MSVISRCVEQNCLRSLVCINDAGRSLAVVVVAALFVALPLDRIIWQFLLELVFQTVPIKNFQ